MRLWIRLAMAAAAVASTVPAQERPQLVWEGEVDSVHVLYARGDRIQIEDKQGLPVQRQRFRFFDRLPQRGLSVRLEVIEGRGRVRILDQPRSGNQYTLAVGIEDPQGGRSFYSLAFFWQAAGGFFDFPPTRGSSGLDRGERLTWSGRVDGEAVVECRAESCEASVTVGQPVVRDRYQFSRPLARQNVQVSLEETDGRGEIRLLEQPREQNDYTVRVLIRDPQGGAADYSFSLSWQRPARGESTPLYANRGLVWSGRVDGRVRVVVQGSTATAESVAGAPVENENARFERALPARPGPNATVRRLRGRGSVEILEYPSARNGYRLVFEIHDERGGAGDYEIEVGW